MCRVVCAHCEDSFLFNTLNNHLARCPHCRQESTSLNFPLITGHYRKISAVGSGGSRKRGLIFLLLGVIFFIFGLAATLGSNGGKGNFWWYLFFFGKTLMT